MIFSLIQIKPYRIVLSNDLVESITIFDVETQLSISKVTEIEIVPNIEDVNLVESNTYIFSHLKKNTIIWIEEKTSFLSELNESLKLKLKDFHTINFSKSRKNKLKNQIILKSNDQPSFNKDLNILEENIIKNMSLGLKTIITTNSDLQQKRFSKY